MATKLTLWLGPADEQAWQRMVAALWPVFGIDNLPKAEAYISTWKLDTENVRPKPPETDLLPNIDRALRLSTTQFVLTTHVSVRKRHKQGVEVTSVDAWCYETEVGILACLNVEEGDAELPSAVIVLIDLLKRAFENQLDEQEHDGAPPASETLNAAPPIEPRYKIGSKIQATIAQYWIDDINVDIPTACSWSDIDVKTYTRYKNADEILTRDQFKIAAGKPIEEAAQETKRRMKPK